MTYASLRRSLPLLPLAPLLALSACGPGAKPPQAVATVAPVVSPLDAAVDLLNKGDEKGAQKALKPLLKTSPNDPSANVLVESIQHDPVELLGAKSFAYTTQPGDTMLGLSDRFLGNRLKFYQLARYNHIAVPASLAAGTVLRIPGEPPAPPPPPHTEKAPAPGASPKPARPKKAPPAAPKAAATNPAAALKLRSLGLAALNQGKVADAVTLLHRAAALDPANPLIARDVTRAERIAQAVRARR
jgi:tetratricopeptide (TPR) repeat protein